ncbi:MAG: CvpA family protein [Alphaproteobacteria bacterium]
MNVIDIGVFAIILLSALLAFSRGLVRELLSVAGWVGAAFATLYLFPLAQPVARDLVSMTLAADLGAALLIFFVTLIAFSIVGGIIARRIHQTDFKLLDRSLGFVFGAARGLILLSLGLLLVNWAYKPEERPKTIREAKSLPVLAFGADLLRSLVPNDFLEGSKVSVDELKKRTRKDIKKSFDKFNSKPRIAEPPKPGATK